MPNKVYWKLRNLPILGQKIVEKHEFQPTAEMATPKNLQELWPVDLGANMDGVIDTCDQVATIGVIWYGRRCTQT